MMTIEQALEKIKSATVKGLTEESARQTLETLPENAALYAERSYMGQRGRLFVCDLDTPTGQRWNAEADTLTRTSSRWCLICHGWDLER